MKKILFLLTVYFTLISCGMNTENKTPEQTPSEPSGKERVEVLYFHGKQRCATCMAIEKNTKEVLDHEFADKIKAGDVVFKIIDISQEENEPIAEKYEVTWSSLFIVKHQEGKENAENMTEFAFANARKSPDVFKGEITKTINQMLE